MKRYLIVEDERFAYEETKRMINKLYPEYIFANWTQSVEQTIIYLQNNPVDLIFLDIQLGDGSSFEIFEHLKIATPIIFTTAYDEFAIKAFKLNSIDYLLKPIEEEELKAAINKFEVHQKETINDINYKNLYTSLVSNQKKNRFLIQRADSYHYVDCTEIAFFYSESKVVFLHTFYDKRYIIDYTLDQIEQQLDASMFFRVSRNCIANIQSIKNILKFFNSRLKLTFEPSCPQEVLVSRVRVPDFLKWVDGSITTE